ncbi:MAG: pyrroline-5-carboxylate reductase [Polynucleobacter sp. 24-46-87]|nr:MAG: pyrroline-5-carboxylate reductase [Polynucleobacter sp. 24-46-87]
MKQQIAIIGGGNLGSAIAEGLINSGFVLPQQLTVTKRNLETIKHLEEKGVSISNDNLAAVSKAHWIILAIKPFQIKEVLQQIQPALNKDQHAIVSVVTGVWIKDIQEIIGEEFPLFRAMPNTAIAIQESMTCICASNASDAQHAFVSEVFNQLGKSVFIEEKLMDAVTAVSGSGPAYVFAFLEAMQSSGEKLGLDAVTARKLAYATLEGATQLAHNSDEHAGVLRERVTSKGGTTAAALDTLKQLDWHGALEKAIDAASQRGKAMGDELGKS